MSKFSELGLGPAFLRATDELGYETATPIQAAAIPVVLTGRDLVGCAQTGTGKTAAFTLPMLDRLMQTLPPRPPKPAPVLDDRRPKKNKKKRGGQPKPRTLRGLVLAPTRELAAQIGESLDKYGRFTPLRHTVVFGGVSQFHQVKALRHGVDTLVATPGRLIDLMQQGHIDLSRIEVLVLDEADQMLDMGFVPALKRIIAKVPEQRQTLMFSATMPKEIRELANQWLDKPESVSVTPVASPAEKIAQSIHFVDKKRKPDLLTHYLRETPRGRTLVFSRTKHGADKIVKRLAKDGLRAAAIHGNKSQNARNRALAQFKSQHPPVLVATDIAARGLDISGVSHVVNFDLPETPETYVHRIGRTARAGAEGVAVSFCAGDERGLLKQIERLTKRAIPVEPTVDGFEPTEKTSHSSPRRSSGRPGSGRPSSGRPGGSRPGGKRFGTRKANGNRSKTSQASKTSPAKSSQANGGQSTGGQATDRQTNGKPAGKPPRKKKTSVRSGEKPTGATAVRAARKRRRRRTTTA